MREVLRDARLVNEQSARPKHPCDLAQRRELSRFSAADVDRVAGPTRPA